MNNRRMASCAAALLVIMLLNGCTTTITDSVTEEKLKVIQKSEDSLLKVEVATDGMLSDVGYANPHPFGIGSEVLVDMSYYEDNAIGRGDIVLFKTKQSEEQETDMARIVGLPGESVQIVKDQVFINGSKLIAFYADDSSSNSDFSMEHALTLKENEYFILADVRWRGFHDSQTAGPFNNEDIFGKVVGYEVNGG